MSAAAESRLIVTHETAYQYSARVLLAYHLAYLTPQSSAHQRVLRSEIHIDPAPAQRSDTIDSFGNRRTHFSLYAPHEALTVRAVSEVQLRARFAQLNAARSAAWTTVRNAFVYRAGGSFWPAADFVFASPFVPLLPELRTYAQQSFTPNRPLVDGAIDLMHRIHADFEYKSASTEISTPLAQVFAQKRGVCQDFAQVMIGALRSLGLPAAYVSGYLLTRPKPGQPRLIGADASHAWVSVWCPSLGWVDLDPTNNVIADTTHVTLAVGRDYGDVTPLRGVIHGGGQHTLSVGVTVLPADEAGAAVAALG